MPTPSYTITCTRHERIANDVYELSFTKPTELEFQAGQFVLFDVPAKDDVSDIQTRAYSVASSPLDEELLFVVKLVPNGRASHWFSEVVKEGTEVRIQGPFGNFTLDAETKSPYLMVCTSTGIAPFYSQLRTILESDTRRIDLVFGVRSEEDLFWTEYLYAMQEAFLNLHVHLVLSRPTEEWKGLTGHVQDVILQAVPDVAERKVYVCGNPDMTLELKKKCIEEWGLAKEDVHIEGFI